MDFASNAANKSTERKRNVSDLTQAMNACNACDGPITTPNAMGYCNECLNDSIGRTGAELRDYLNSLVNNYAEARRPQNWKRPAHPTVYQARMDYIASGRYPYNESVVQYIIEKFGLADPTLRYDHQAIHDRDDKLAIMLTTEVYIASCEQSRNDNIAKRDSLLAAGYSPITELEPQEGMKIQFHDSVIYRLVKGQHDWVLLPPRKRTWGLSLNALQSQHRQVELAEHTYHHDGGAVVRMFKVVK